MAESHSVLCKVKTKTRNFEVVICELDGLNCVRSRLIMNGLEQKGRQKLRRDMRLAVA